MVTLRPTHFVTAVVLTIACAASTTHALTQTPDPAPATLTPAAVRAAVKLALSRPPIPGYFPIPKDVRLLSARVRNTPEETTITLDFNRQLLRNGTGLELEDALRQIENEIVTEVVKVTPKDRRPSLSTNVLIEGVPLVKYLPK